MRLKMSLIENIEELMNRHNQRGEARNQVADVTIVFKNTSQIVDILKHRGDALQNGDKIKRAKLDKKLNKYIKANRDTLREPMQAFITCETRVGYQRLLKNNMIKLYGSSKFVR